MSVENQKSLSDWANETFGSSGTNLRVAIRANEEMAELLLELALDDHSQKAPSEIADIFIILYRLAERMGVDVHDEIDKKMVINRARTWEQDGSGHGYHVKTYYCAHNKTDLDPYMCTPCYDKKYP